MTPTRKRALMTQASTVRILMGTVFALLTLGVALPPAFAHGDTPSTKQPGFDPSSAEQKAFGIAGDPKKATRTIKITMTDKMRFSPDTITVKQGETVKFDVANNGTMLHEMVIGTMEELMEHSEMMKKFPEMEHEEPYMTHVAPRKSETMVWTFNRPGDFKFACLIPGHFDAGMIGNIKVVARK